MQPCLLTFIYLLLFINYHFIQKETKIGWVFGGYFHRIKNIMLKTMEKGNKTMYSSD